MIRVRATVSRLGFMFGAVSRVRTIRPAIASAGCGIGSRLSSFRRSERAESGERRPDLEKTLKDCAQELGAIIKAEVGIAWIGDAERNLKLLTYLETNAFEVWGPTQPHIEPPLNGRVLIIVMLVRTGEARSIRLYELSDADTARWQSLGRSSTSFGKLEDSVVN